MLTHISLFILHSMCLSVGQFAKIISFPPSRTAVVILVLLKYNAKLQFSLIMSEPELKYVALSQLYLDLYLTAKRSSQ